MKIIHFSDTHLGYSEYNKIDQTSGINQREQDFYNTWNEVVDAILTEKPDVVVHAGDLFHTPRPSNRAIRIALSSIQRLSDAGIPLVIIAGNHETPRIRATGSIFESIALFPNVYPAFENAYQRFRIQKDAEYNVLISHGAWSGKEFFGMGEFNELRLPDIEGLTGHQFDYIALGHYHRHVEVAPHAMYSSSTERTSLNEYNADCGYLRIDLQDHSHTYVPVNARAMLKLDPVDCSGLSSAQIYAQLQKLATDQIKDAIVQLSLIHIENDAFIKLDVREIERIFTDAFYLEKQLVRQADVASTLKSDMKIESLSIEFERYLKSVPEGELNKERLVEIAAAYLQTED